MSPEPSPALGDIGVVLQGVDEAGHLLDGILLRHFALRLFHAETEHLGVLPTKPTGVRLGRLRRAAEDNHEELPAHRAPAICDSGGRKMRQPLTLPLSP
jgi:hypothetical protein